MKENRITRKHLVYSLLTGLVIGAIAGTPIGWFTHRTYAEQRLAKNLICREQHRNEPVAVVESICGSRF
ncbi:hypothetical protein [Coleofasciculus sp. FACHB-1120]|uniref:hypothetical protein n=1 Tax=Coleofasciculus sp. FACHB-1120 TaxID=2692783 RepID=UPI0016874373|nr:hypothetical protein [Coleofasciculus sp. FACHB-1120]MBD2744744.1 hypothetical protein [Coleofasciculus sp. FACHB-1120]